MVRGPCATWRLSHAFDVFYSLHSFVRQSRLLTMASLYNLEPQPTAKVILHTTAGDLSLELFAKQTPLASRNFLQHCLDGYYNNTIFHRLVPDFIVQGGDPTGTGHGGISALNDGAGFEDEVHSRLKFNRRGLLGMAREEGGNNGSQFFLTLGETKELQGRHTMFGRIEGDTIYNLMKMGEVELADGEGSERPLYPTRVTATEVLVNPFEDMIARVREAPRTRDTGQKEVKKRKKPAGKNVLSFGMDEGEEDGSVHSPTIKKLKANPKLVVTEDDTEQQTAPAIPAKKVRKPQKEDPENETDVPVKAAPIARPPAKPIADNDEDNDSNDGQDSETTAAQARSKAQLEKTNAEIAALKASMKRTVDKAPQAAERPKNALEAMIPATSTRGRKRGKVADEKGVFDMFRAFKNRLEDLPAATESTGQSQVDEADAKNSTTEQPAAAGANEDDEAALCDLHFIANCQSCKAWDEDVEGDNDGEGELDDGAWMAHSLTFVKDTLGKDLEWKRKMEEIEVIDPREKARVIKEEARKGRKEEVAKRTGRVK
nr:peptidyl-prolyl isomerase cwc27 [Quercus suber]